MKAPRRSHVDRETLLRMMAMSAVVAIFGGASDVADGKKGRKRGGRSLKCYLPFLVVRIVEPFPGLVPPCLGLANGAHLDTIELWTYSVGAIYPSEIIQGCEISSRATISSSALQWMGSS